MVLVVVVVIVVVVMVVVVCIKKGTEEGESFKGILYPSEFPCSIPCVPSDVNLDLRNGTNVLELDVESLCPVFRRD